jgi:exocyst complex component 4
MEVSPPVKPPRGVKPVKETSGLLMSVIRTLSASETNEQRDKEKSKLENEYKNCDKKLDELVSKHEEDLSKVMQLFATISQIVSDNRSKIAKVKENLQDCKKKLRCRRDELRNLWLEGLEYKYMLQLLEEIEKMSEVPNRLANYMTHKQYLHATKLLVEAVSLGKNTLEGVESLKELSRELEQKKEQLHIQLFNELKEHLFTRPAQRIVALRRQESGRDNFMINSPLQRSTELRLSRNRMAVRRNIMESAQKLEVNDFQVVEDLSNVNPEENSFHFIVILIKCLALLDKLPFAVNKIKDEMQVFLLAIVQRTTQHIKDFSGLQTEVDYKHSLKELVQTLFDQFKEIAEAHAHFSRNVEEAAKVHGTQVKTYTVQFYWAQVQCVLEAFLNEYLDVQNISSDAQVMTTSDVNDLSSYFGRRKQPTKKKSLFKFDSSSSALTLSSTLKTTKKDKIVVCRPHSNNILVVFVPFMCFIEDIEQLMGVQNGPCLLHRFITQYVSDIYLKRKSEEIIDQIEGAVRAADAWKATVLLDCTADYKPLLISTVTVERCVREWRAVLQALPLYSERIAVYSCKALKEYKDTCFAAYQGLVQPHSEDRRICSAAWLKDEDISRFLKYAACSSWSGRVSF